MNELRSFVHTNRVLPLNSLRSLTVTAGRKELEKSADLHKWYRETRLHAATTSGDCENLPGERNLGSYCLSRFNAQITTLRRLYRSWNERRFVSTVAIQCFSSRFCFTVRNFHRPMGRASHEANSDVEHIGNIFVLSF